MKRVLRISSLTVAYLLSFVVVVVVVLVLLSATSPNHPVVTFMVGWFVGNIAFPVILIGLPDPNDVDWFRN